jgi:nitrous oxide reductase accessory protein NosL
LHISSEDRCPVCAMLPIRYPRFAAAIELAGGRTYYFCSPGCMLNAWLHPDIFLGTEPARLKRPVVLEYLSGEAVDGRDVFWVSGSDVVGPMGPALVPLKDKAHLEAFRRRHGAKQVFRLDELTHDNWEKLTGKPPSRR